jgi:hypothetical protein
VHSRRYIVLRLADEVLQHPAQADGVITQFMADERLAAGSRVAFGEDQVEDSQDRIEPLGQQVRGRDVVRNARVFLSVGWLKLPVYYTDAVLSTESTFSTMRFECSSDYMAEL